jgi:fumarate hydratase class II
MPVSVVESLLQVKKAYAAAHTQLGLFSKLQGDAITAACDVAVAALQKQGAHRGEEEELVVTALTQMPLYQTGSGTFSNMNVNEVISALSLRQCVDSGELQDRKGNREAMFHPNNHINASQSTNDVFLVAMHISTHKRAQHTLEALEEMAVVIEKLVTKYKNDVKMGRTHLMDALPIKVGQEWSGYAAQLDGCIVSLRRNMQQIAEQVPLCATAVGTGVNVAEGLQEQGLLLPLLREYTGIPGLCVSPSLFASLSSCDTLVTLHGALKNSAVVLNKIANDVRLSASGPRGGVWSVCICDVCIVMCGVHLCSGYSI